MDESMSTSDSTKSLEVEYMDRSNATNVASLERKALQNLYISKHSNSKSREGAVPRVEFSSSVFK